MLELCRLAADGRNPSGSQKPSELTPMPLENRYTAVRPVLRRCGRPVQNGRASGRRGDRAYVGAILLITLCNAHFQNRLSAAAAASPGIIRRTWCRCPRLSSVL